MANTLISLLWLTASIFFLNKTFIGLPDTLANDTLLINYSIGHIDSINDLSYNLNYNDPDKALELARLSKKGSEKN